MSTHFDEEISFRKLSIADTGFFDCQISASRPHGWVCVHQEAGDAEEGGRVLLVHPPYILDVIKVLVETVYLLNAVLPHQNIGNSIV